MQEELLQFQLQKVWTLVNLPYSKRAIGTKWVFRNKKDERGIVVRNKARLVTQGYTQEEGIDYDEVFAPVARIEAIRLFLAYASFMGFIVYQMDVKSAFLYGSIEEEVYVYQPPGFEDPHFPNKEYNVEKDLYGLHQAPKAWYETLTSSMGDEFEGLMHKRFQMSSMGELTFFLGLQVQQKEDGIFISQDKYVAKILKKFDFATVKTPSTPIETNKALVKDEEVEAVDVHLYRSMIGSLMYLTASRPDIMFAVCACARDLPFDLEAFSNSDYVGANLDRKSTTGGCQFLGKRLILWQCKKQTIVANSTTEAEYVAAANCCGQVLWIQNQMLDYGFNFMNTKIYIDNESTICIVKNLVFHSKTKHIEIRHHFIRDSYEKKLIQVIKIHTDHNVLTKAFDVSRLDERECIIKQKWVKDETVYKEWEDRMERAATTASSLEAEQDSGSGPRCQDTILGGAEAQSRFEAASKQSNDPPLSRVNTFGSGEDSMKLMELMEHFPTGRVVVPTGRYVVPAGKVIIIVSPGRLSLVPTGRVLSPGSDNESDDASVHSEATIAQQQQNIQPQIITTVSNNNAKFPYLKKDEYEVWAMKMEYWITNNDMNIWKVIQNGNSLKRTGRDRDGRVIILPPTTADEHIAVQRESKARTTLLQSIPDDHVADFHYMDDVRDIWNAVKARFGGNAESKKMRKSILKQEFLEFRISEAEGLHKGYDRMQKILSQLNQLKAKPEDEDINLKFLRALPSSWSQVALTLKTKGGLELLSFDDLYYKLKTLEVDIKGYSTFSSSQPASPSHYAFVSTTGASKKMSYADSPSYSSSTYTAPSNFKTGSHRSDNVIEDVLQSFVVDTEPEQQLAYKDFEQIEKMDLEEMDLKWQMAILSVRVHKLEQKARRKVDFDKKESARFNKKTEHDGQSDGVIAPKEFGMIAGCDTKDAIEEGAAKIYNLITGADTKEASTAGDAGEFALMGVTSKVHNCPFGCGNKYNELQKQHNEFNEQNSKYFIQVQAYKNSLKTLEKQKRVLQKNQLTLEDKIWVLSIELENTTNLLKHSERINAIAETAKKELQTKLDNHFVQIEKWRTSSINLFRLIVSSMSVRRKVGLGFNNYIRENELVWDDSTFSVFTTNSEEVEGRPLFNRFAKADSMKDVPPPLSGDYTSLSGHIDLDESQMSYGTKSSTSGDSNSVSNDFVFCDNSDKSSQVNTNDFASSDSSVKSSEPKSNDSTSCASTSSVSTSESEAEIESNVGTLIQEPITV
ncbi:putative ribonuclease H-like domain-containing protein [Tanacetum coccineum]